MSEGITKEITGSLTLTNKYEMTQNDDILNIVNATLYLSPGDGQLFTNSGNDTVTVTNSTVNATAAGLSFFLGNGDDALTLSNSTLNAPTRTGSGNDLVRIAGDVQSVVTLLGQSGDSTLSLDDNDDILEIAAILTGDGSIDFGTGNDTLRFDGGTLSATGAIYSLTNLATTGKGGALKRDITLTGATTRVTLGGTLNGSGTIYISDSETTVTIADNVQSTVGYSITAGIFRQTAGGTIALSGSGVYAEYSTVDLHDWVISAAGYAISGSRTDWSFSKSNFSNNTAAAVLTGGSLKLTSVGISKHSATALQLTGTTLTGSDVSFRKNSIGGASGIAIASAYGGGLRSHAKVTLASSEWSGNTASASAADAYSTAYDILYSSSSAGGGAIYHGADTMSLIHATFSGNTAAALGHAAYHNARVALVAATAGGGAIYQSGGMLTLTTATFSGNTAFAFARAYASSLDRLYDGYATASASALGGAICQTGGTLTLTTGIFSGNTAAASATGRTFIDNHSASGIAIASALGGAIYQAGGTLTLAAGTFSGNTAVASATATAITQYTAKSFATATALGGAIYQAGGTLTLTGAAFSGNTAAATALASATDYAYTYSSALGGAIYLAGAAASLTDAVFSGNIATATACSSATATSRATAAAAAAGGAIYMGGKTTLNYAVSSGKELALTGNCAESGGLLYIADSDSKATFDVAEGAVLTIGSVNNADAAGKSYDSIAGLGNIVKAGSGLMCVNSDVSGFNGVWTVSEGVLELASRARNILLNDWTIGVGAELRLSSLNDTVIMTVDKEIGALDFGGGDDTFSFTRATFGKRLDLGDGNNTLTATGQAVFSDAVAGGAGDDTITLSADAVFAGAIDLGGGKNQISISGTADITGKVKMTAGGETNLVILSGATTKSDSVTVIADEAAQTSSATLNWSSIPGLDKVRILVSSDITFNSFEFALELHNGAKSFTINAQDGYFIQFQAQDADGWKQRLLPDTVAPEQVDGLAVANGELSWNAAHDNFGGNGVKQYRVEIATDSSFAATVTASTTEDIRIALSGLADGNYFLRVSAEDYTGNVGAWSRTLSYSVDTTAPLRPTGGRASVDGYVATLSWNAAIDSVSGVAFYEYRVASDANFTTIVTSGLMGATGVTLYPLQYGTYYFQVRATDTAGNIGDWSLSQSFSPVDAVAPGAPANLDYRVTGTSCLFVWDSALDDALGGGVAKYEIELALDADFVTVVKSESVISNTEITFSELTDATFYARVRAVDAAGNKSAWSASSNFVVGNPEVEPPTPPSGLSVVLNWNASTDGKSGVKGYVVSYTRETLDGRTEKSGVFSPTNSLTLTIAGIGFYSWTVKAVDNAGNTSVEVAGDDFIIASVAPGKYETLYGSVNGGNAELLVDSSRVKSIIAGAEVDVAGNVNASVGLLAAASPCNVYGGGNNVNVGGNIDLALTGGGYSGVVYGGSRAYAKTVAVHDIAVSVGGIVHSDNQKLIAAGKGNSAWIVGGGIADNGQTLTVGAVNITLDGANIVRVVGGAQAQNAGSTATAASVNITVRNSTLAGDLFGGGYAYNGGTSVVYGGTAVTIDTTAANVTVMGNIYSGGANPSYYSKGGSTLVQGGSTVTFTGLGEKLTVGTVSGDGMIAGMVSGVRTLEFRDFYGEFSANVKNFDLLKFAGTSEITAGPGYGANTFKFDLTGRDASYQGVAFIQDAAAFTFADGDKLLQVELGATSGSYDLMAVEDEYMLDGLKVELFKNDALLCSFNYGETKDGYSLAYSNGILALMKG
ncbi:MAG: hypothetical protein PHI85_04140 [Victivallaceae bacterium]|nr:hypothetical protein [Victivallaceae bacterium]